MAIDVVEVAFKAGRIGIYANRVGLTIKQEDYVIVEADKGMDLGKVIQRGHLFYEDIVEDELKNVARIATSDDLKKYEENRQLEEKAVRICKDKIVKHQLNMNLVDAEYQWDHNKLTFYFT
ncbi:MAG: hypothetical protein D6748_09480, partial [Calditrichaeota bacterium]